jgi:hypothetical protein
MGITVHEFAALRPDLTASPSFPARPALARPGTALARLTSLFPPNEH